MDNDLISRAALLKYTTRMTEYDESGCGVPVLVVRAEDIENSPAVDAEPVRHGKWSKRRKIGDVWCCSECGFGQLVSASFMYKEGCIGHTDNRTRFCPNCGTRMDAEVKE